MAAWEMMIVKRSRQLLPVDEAGLCVQLAADEEEEDTADEGCS